MATKKSLAFIGLIGVNNTSRSGYRKKSGHLNKLKNQKTARQAN